MASIADISLRYNMRRNALPTFQRTEALLESKNLSQEAALLAPHFIEPVKNAEEFKNLKEYFDHEYTRLEREMMEWLPGNSFSYLYLALSHDMRHLHDFYLNYFEKKQSYTEKQLMALINQLPVLKMHQAEIIAANARVGTVSSSFEFFAQLDHVYFEALKKAAYGAGEFVRLFVGTKIDSFNIMTVSRLQRMHKEHLNAQFLVENPYGIDINTLVSEPLQELLQRRLGFSSFENFEDLEKQLKMRELNFLSKAIFHGLGEEVILLCLEMIASFFYDLKLIAIAQELSSDKQQIKNHLINYDLHI